MLGLSHSGNRSSIPDVCHGTSLFFSEKYKYLHSDTAKVTHRERKKKDYGKKKWRKEKEERKERAKVVQQKNTI